MCFRTEFESRSTRPLFASEFKSRSVPIQRIGELTSPVYENKL